MGLLPMSGIFRTTGETQPSPKASAGKLPVPFSISPPSTAIDRWTRRAYNCTGRPISMTCIGWTL